MLPSDSFILGRDLVSIQSSCIVYCENFSCANSCRACSKTHHTSYMGDQRKRILIVDDEESVRESLRLLLKTNFDVHTAPGGNEALNLLTTFEPDLVLLDVLMPQIDGVETLRRLREKKGTLPVVMLTASSMVRTAVQAMKYGAVDYINKPFDIDELTSLILAVLQRTGDEAISFVQPNRERPTRAGIIPLSADFGQMVGTSPVMQEVFKKVAQVASRDTTVLITGESGTGKELVARRIHELSPRANEPFVAINCAAIPETLIESELFGHERGAFTHAVEKRIGHFELADRGTLFLDEIGELSLPVQVKMLRFLQEQEFFRVGRSKPIRVDVRIVAATNRNLEELITLKRFRQDLFYRINVVSLKIPPLKDRFDDILPLAEYFVKKLSPLYGGRSLRFSQDAQEVLRGYHWPGNVRELENVVESLLALSTQDDITAADLPHRVLSHEGSSTTQQIFHGSLSFEDAERLFETEMIEKALKKSNYVQTKAAEILGISRRILKYKMDKLGISDKPQPQGVAVNTEL
jgi:DNA-binding NtrC family response regulator